jgi:hypothetical protein
MSMDMSKYIGSVFLKPGDVKAGPIRVTIKDVVEGEYDKPVLVFDDGTRLSLNRTNTRVLVRAYGNNSENWIGKEIELYLGRLEYDDKLNEAVLVKPISPSIGKKASPQPGEGSGGMDDEIPFSM